MAFAEFQVPSIVHAKTAHDDRPRGSHHTNRPHARQRERAVTLLEYGDYQCPRRGMARPVIKARQEHFAADLRFVFRHFALADLHPFAEPASETAQLGGQYGRFWPMHDGLYQNQEVLGVPLFVAPSEALGVTKQKLIDALKQQNFKAKIETDVMGGVRSGVSGTPALFIDGNRYRGAYDFNALAAAVRGYREADAHL